jgi:hypothetical protein
MLSLDLFNSKFEQHLVEGAVDRVVEQDPSEPQEKIPTNINQFNTEDNRALVKRIWAQISQHAVNDTAGWLTLEWPNQPAATLSRNQVWTVINKIAKMPTTQRNAFALSTLGDRNAFLTWMNGLKIIPRPAPKKDVPKGQQSLDLKELDQKKSSEDNKYRDVRVARAMRQAAAEFPSAGSDVEAFAKSMLNAQDKDQEDIDRLRQTTQRQRELIKKNDSLDADQQRTIVGIEKEIDDVDRSNSTLEKTVQQMQRANQALQQKLDQMRGRATQSTATPTAPELGVSVATDKAPTAPATTSPAIDPRARQYAQALRKQLNQLQTMVALKAPEDQNQLKQDIDALKAQLAKLQQQEPVATATPATVGGQAADIMPARGSTDTDADDGVIDLTGVDDVLAQFRQPAKKVAKKKAKKQEPEFELTEENKIPLKKVFGGYTITFEPATKTVSAFRGLSGPQQGNSIKINNATPGAYLRAVRQLLGDEVAEGSVFGQQKFDTQMDLAKLKSQLEKTKPAQSASAEPQPVAYQSPARLSDLEIRRQRVANLADIKQTIEQLQARATRGGRELPRGLAADLEDYFTVNDVDIAYDDMMSKYQKQLSALQHYLGMRKVLWSPKKDIHENKSNEAYEQGGRAGYYGRPYNNPYKSGTDDHADYKRGYRDFRDEGKDYGVEKKKRSPGIDRDRDYLEDIDRSGQKMYKAQEAYMIVHNGRDIAFYKPSDMKQAYADAEELAKKHGGEVHVKKVMREGRAGFNPLRSRKDWLDVQEHLARLMNTPGMSYEDKQVIRQRYLEKQKEAQEKGFTK